MFSTTTVSTRELLRHYKRVIDSVKKTNEPAIVISQNEPQVAIISLDALHILKEAHQREASQALAETVQRVRALLKHEHLPADLSARHDHYLWHADPIGPTDVRPAYPEPPTRDA